MKNQQAKAVLKLLLNGIDPVTGECLDDDHVCARPLVMRALHCAIETLDMVDPPPFPEDAHRRRARLPANRPWTREEDEQLRRLREAGYSVARVIDTVRERTPKALINRMLYLGLIGSRDDVGREVTPGMERRGTPWYPEDDEKLKELFSNGTDAERIAKEMKRSKYSIACRLEKLGLIEDREQLRD